MELRPQLKGLQRCPQCSVSYPLLNSIWSGSPSNANGITRQTALYICTSCGLPVVAIARAGDDRNHPYVDAIFPKPQRVADDLPPAAQRFLKQARETIHAPDASAVMAASAVDAMLKARGYVEGTLNSRIAKAVDDHVLTTDMGQWAHSVRLESNRPRHADAEDPHVSDDEAKRSIAFAEALAQFLFVLPAMIQRGIAEAND